MRIIFAGAFVAGLIYSTVYASAHKWYDGACCNEIDCKDLRPGDVLETKDGYFIQSKGWKIPYGSKIIRYQGYDTLFHVCEAPKWVNMRKVGTEPRCFYIPGAGT